MVKKVTSQRVKQSMAIMLLGRPLSAVGGLFVLILLSRTLPAAEYGEYFSLWATAEIIILASNFGLIHVVYRYVSADEWLDGTLSIRGPVWRLLGLRVLTLLPATLFLCTFPSAFDWMGKAGLSQGTLGYLGLIVAGEGMARFLEAVFDSMLSQGRSQLTLTVRTVIRLAGYAYFLSHDGLGLVAVLQVEVTAALGGASLGLALMLALQKNASRRETPGLEEVALGPTFRQVAGFALPAYLAQLLTLTYGPDALKLILASNAGPQALALFGFAYSLAAVVLRYIPANLLAGVFRPIFVAASQKNDAKSILPILLGMSIKINWLVILPVLCALVSGGSPMLSLISGGHYPSAGLIVSILVAALLLIAVHLTLSMYCLALGVSWPLLLATGTSALMLPGAFLLVSNHDAVGVSCVFVLTEFSWCAVCYGLVLRYTGGRLPLDWSGMFKLLAFAVLAILFSSFASMLGSPWYIGSSFSALIFCCVSLKFLPFTSQERAWLIRILPSNRIIVRILA